MTHRLTLRFEPLADLYLLLIDPARRPNAGTWAEANDAIDRCIAELSKASGGRQRPIGAFHGGVAEMRSLDELEAAIPSLPDDSVLGLPWERLVTRALQALKLAWPIYADELLHQRSAVVSAAIDERVDSLLQVHEADCVSYIHESFELPDGGRVIPEVFVGSAPFPGAFTSFSDATGAICFVGLDGLDGTSLLETVLHEAIHAFEMTSEGRRRSVPGRLGRRIAEILPDDRAVLDVPHSLIFVQAAETVRRIIDPAHVHYGVSHTYYDRVPTSKPVLEHWVRHLDGTIAADGAIEAIASDLANASRA